MRWLCWRDRPTRQPCLVTVEGLDTNAQGVRHSRMSDEQHLIDALRGLARQPAARELRDDAAVLPAPLGRDLVLTHDMLVEGVHYLPGDPPGDVAWKLLAVNLSDLAAKGARPVGILLGYSLGETEWDQAFVAGLATA